MSFEHHPNSKKVFDYYQKRYSTGSLGIWHSLCLASLYIANKKPRMEVVLSSIIVADGGSFKSQLMSSFKENYKDKYWLIPDQSTDRALVREFNNKKIDNKLWLIDDAAVTIPSLEGQRQTRLLGLFTRVIMDQEYSYADFSETKYLKGRVGLVMNIAHQNFYKISEVLMELTFLERVVPFNFTLNSFDVDKLNNEYYNGIEYGKPPKLKFRKQEVKSNESFNNDFNFLTNFIANSCVISSTRAQMWARTIAYSLALTENRNYLIKEDFKFLYKYITPYLSLKTRIEPVERAMIRMLRLNPNATIGEFDNFLKSEICVTEFPHEEIIYSTMNEQLKKNLFNKSRNFVNSENNMLKVYGVDFIEC